MEKEEWKHLEDEGEELAEYFIDLYNTKKKESGFEFKRGKAKKTGVGIYWRHLDH